MTASTVALCILAGAVLSGVPDLVAQEAPEAEALAGAIPSPPPESTEAPTPEPVPAPMAEPPRPRGAYAGPTRLLFAPTARSMPRGRGSLQLTEALFPWAEVGLLNHVSLGGYGIVPMEDTSNLWFLALNPKIQVLDQPGVQAAVGSFVGTSGGLGYGVVTLGSPSTSLTVGYGHGFGTWSEVERHASPYVVFMGAEKALGGSCRLILEAYLGGTAFGLPEQTLLVGARFGKGRWSADVGAIVPLWETGGGLAVPVFTLGWAF